MHKCHISVITMLALLPACSNHADVSIKHDLFIQLQSSSDLLESLIAAITPIINAGIKEELGLAQDDPFEFFLPKKQQKLTVYYVNDIREDGIAQLLASLDSVEKNKLTTTNSPISLSPHIEFFGNPVIDVKDELVIMINDPQQRLTALNNIMKTTARSADDMYKQTCKQSLYDVNKSERYPYLPHMGLGRIRSTSIKEKNKTGVSFEKLQQRVLRDVQEAINSLFADKNLALHFKTMIVFDLQKRATIKDYPL